MLLRVFLPGFFATLVISAASAQSPAPPNSAAMVIPAVSTPVIYTDPSQPVAQRVDDLIARMSLAEKVGQLQNSAPAIPRLNVPAYDYWSEALHGVAREGIATVFPQAIGMAATWDVDLIHAEGETIATEGRAKYNTYRDAAKGQRYGGLTFWSPNVNIFRDPRWGRGQETYGEDPVLTGHLGVAFITGIQGDDPLHAKAVACAKHYAVHSGPEPERHRFNVDPSERDLYETYLPQFEECVREGHVGQIMSAYNAVYGVPAPASKLLLTDILRTKWGFDGYVVSDCDAVADIVGGHHYVPTLEQAVTDAVKAGTDLNCGHAYAALVKAVDEKLITEAEVDAALHRVLTERFRLGLFDPSTPWDQIGAADLDTAASSDLALKAARESIVLLKNDGLLPLDRSKIKHLAIIGANAKDTEMLLGNYNGTPSHPVSIFDGIVKAAGSGVQVDYAAGPPLATKAGETFAESSPGWDEAMKVAKAADVIIYVGGISPRLEGEEMKVTDEGFTGGDRTRIELPEVQEKFVEALAAAGKPVVFVNCSGSAIALKWEAAHLPAIVQAWYPGENGGTAVGEILFGDVNPSGRLPVTFYAATANLPPFTDYSMAKRTYRYFAGQPLWAFGHGLSYTKFDYGTPTLSATTFNATGTIHLSIPVTNSGSRDGDEVVQVYVKHEKSADPQPIHSLAAFQRISVPKGQTVSAELDLPAHQLRYWDVKTHDYIVEPGTYEVQIGAASNDLRQKQEISVSN